MAVWLARSLTYLIFNNLCCKTGITRTVVEGKWDDAKLLWSYRESTAVCIFILSGYSRFHQEQQQENLKNGGDSSCHGWRWAVTSWVVLDTLFCLSELRFPHLSNEENNTNFKNMLRTTWGKKDKTSSSGSSAWPSLGWMFRFALKQSPGTTNRKRWIKSLVSSSAFTSQFLGKLSECSD